MLPASQFVWQTVTILQKFQFPWRFLHLAVFCIAVLGGFVMSKIKKQIAFSILITIGLLATTYPTWKAKEYRQYAESFFTGIYKSTTDTGESSPIWSVRFMEREPVAPVEVIEGSAEVELGLRNTTKREYKVNAPDRVRLLENTLYFPGWRVFVDGTEVPVEFQDPTHRGLMTFLVDPGQHTVLIQFTRTKMRLFAEFLSFAGFVLLAGMLIYNRTPKA